MFSIYMSKEGDSGLEEVGGRQPLLLCPKPPLCAGQEALPASPGTELSGTTSNGLFLTNGTLLVVTFALGS